MTLEQAIEEQLKLQKTLETLEEGTDEFEEVQGKIFDLDDVITDLEYEIELAEQEDFEDEVTDEDLEDEEEYEEDSEEDED